MESGGKHGGYKFHITTVTTAGVYSEKPGYQFVFHLLSSMWWSHALPVQCSLYHYHPTGILVSIKMILNAALNSGFVGIIYGKRQGQVMCLLFTSGIYTTIPMAMSSRLPYGHQYVICKIYRGCCVDNLLFVVWFLISFTDECVSLQLSCF